MKLELSKPRSSFSLCRRNGLLLLADAGLRWVMVYSTRPVSSLDRGGGDKKRSIERTKSVDRLTRGLGFSTEFAEEAEGSWAWTPPLMQSRFPVPTRAWKG